MDSKTLLLVRSKSLSLLFYSNLGSIMLSLWKAINFFSSRSTYVTSQIYDLTWYYKMRSTQTKTKKILRVFLSSCSLHHVFNPLESSPISRSGCHAAATAHMLMLMPFFSLCFCVDHKFIAQTLPENSTRLSFISVSFYFHSTYLNSAWCARHRTWCFLISA